MAAKTQPKGFRLRKLADRSGGDRVPTLRIPAGAVLIDPDTGDVIVAPADAQKFLLNPATEGYDHEPWPLAGIAVEGDVLKHVRVSTSYVTNAAREGWMTVEGGSVEHAPGGPEGDPWRVTHTFEHADAIVLHTVDGDLRYRVVHQPGKYDDPAEPSGKRVDWFFDLELEG